MKTVCVGAWVGVGGSENAGENVNMRGGGGGQ